MRRYNKTAILLLAVALAAVAEEGDGIPAQPLSSALAADQWQLQVVYLDDVAAGIESRGADGNVAPETALDQLLADTGLEYKFINDRTVAIEPPVTDRDNVDLLTARAGRATQFGQRELLAQLQPERPPAGQTPPPAERPAPSSRGFVIEQVIVTARRVEENLQDTPISVSVFSGDELDRRQIFGSDDLDQIAPNMQFTSDTTLAGNNSSSAVFIRGIGQTDPTATVDPGVGLYIDDVYISQSVGATMELRDIASVQVLRGPQGTLFGRNTIGGAMVLTT